MKSLLILIAGPVRSGTNNRAELIDANLNNMAQVALRVYQKGHIPWSANGWLAHRQSCGFNGNWRCD
jgi:hypothetical protein